MKNPTTFIIVTSLALSLGSTGCGFKPPKEYLNVAKTDPATIEEIPASGDLADASVDSGEPLASTTGNVPIALGFTTVGGITFEKLLGRTEKEIGLFLSATQPKTPEEETAFAADAELGWLHYANHLKLKIEGGLVVGLTQMVPQNLDCAQAATWMGFDQAREAKMEEGVSCKWSLGDLGDALEGDMDIKTRVFSVMVITPTGSAQ